MIARLCVLRLLGLLNTVVTEEVTELPLKQRVDFLKFKIKDELREQMKTAEKPGLRQGADNILINAHYDYVDLSQVPITPINEKDDRKKHNKFKLRQLATTTTATSVWTRKSARSRLMRDRTATTVSATPPLKLFNPLSDNDNNIKPRAYKDKREKRSKDVIPAAMKPVTTEQPVDVFYRHRRLLQDESIRDTSIRWIHCEDLITPFLTGMKGELSAPKWLGPKNKIVTRLLHLLNTDMTNAPKEDVLSVMYQISNVQIRLFQWEGTSISMLFETFTKGRPHTYRNIKYGLKKLFYSWNIDISNVTNLLSQSRLFRPACVNSKNQDGSTKSSKVTRYTRPGEKTKTTCKSTTPACDDDE